VPSKKILRAGVELKRLTRRPFADRLSPFAGETRPAIIHSCYHKVGTVWFLRVLREMAAHFGMTFGTGDDYPKIAAFEEERSVDVFLDYGSHVRLDQLDGYVGSHMIRDPRDMVVSGYFYHLWTQETWVHFPLAEYRGRSYQQYLNHLDREEGLLEEIRRMSFWIPHMMDWDYANPRIYEIRYEDIMQDEERIMREMFAHYGFRPEAVEASCRIAEKYTFKRMAGSGGGESHLRSGRTGEWEEHFGPAHRALFKELYPGVVSGLGYEADENW
jgi:hypothetical protein